MKIRSIYRMKERNRNKKTAGSYPSCFSLSSGEHVFATYLLCTLSHQITKASYLVIDNMDKLDAKSFKLFVELLEDDTSYDNIILGAVNHDDTLEQLKGTGLKIVNL